MFVVYSSATTVRRERKVKKTKLPGQPKRYASAYFIWMNESRESIKAKFPGLSVTDFGRKSGELWKEMTDKSVRLYLIFKLFSNHPNSNNLCHGRFNRKPKPCPLNDGTGPLACLSLLPVAELDKESND